jgi:hypothetical protein
LNGACSLNKNPNYPDKSMTNTIPETTHHLTGSCLCGGAKYSIEAEVRDFYYCHCSQCRKITGSNCAANILVKRVEVTWAGDEHLRRYDVPGRSFTKVFCTTCGSGLPFLNATGDSLIIPAGSLDVPAPMNPIEHIFWADKADWDTTQPLLPVSDGFPKQK